MIKYDFYTDDQVTPESYSHNRPGGLYYYCIIAFLLQHNNHMHFSAFSAFVKHLCLCVRALCGHKVFLISKGCEYWDATEHREQIYFLSMKWCSSIFCQHILLKVFPLFPLITFLFPEFPSVIFTLWCKNTHTGVKHSHSSFVSSGGRWCLRSEGSGLERTHWGSNSPRWS